MTRRSHRNVPIGAEFARRVTALRTARHLTKSELADRAGLTERTVRDLEAGRRRAVQEKTLMLIAEALGMDVATLLGPPDSPDPQPAPDVRYARGQGLALVVAAVATLMMLSGGAWLWQASHARPAWSVDEGVLTVRDPVFERTLWQLGGNDRILVAMESPWSPGRLLVGFDNITESGNRLLCLDISSGDTAWTASPDREAVARIFGRDAVGDVNFQCKDLGVADLRGDGSSQVVALFVHGLYYPTVVMVVAPGGTVESEYANKGHVVSVRIADLDRDGADEIVCAGTNNEQHYQGATVFILDETHRSGASVDRPQNGFSDGSFARLVLPAFPEPYMNQLGDIRLTAYDLEVRPSDASGSPITVKVQTIRGPIGAVHLADDLQPLGFVLMDDFAPGIVASWPESLRVGNGPTDPAWRRAWLDRATVFRRGVPGADARQGRY